MVVDETIKGKMILIAMKEFRNRFIFVLLRTLKNKLLRMWVKTRMVTLGLIVEEDISIVVRNMTLWIRTQDAISDLARPTVDVRKELRWDISIFIITNIESANVDIWAYGMPRGKVNTIVATMDNKLDVVEAALISITVRWKRREAVDKFFHMVIAIVL